MAIVDWIDALTKVFEVTAHGNRGKVRSFRLFERDEFPESIDPADFPVALSYPTQVRTEYSQGGPKKDYWMGQTELHLFPDAKKSNLPELLRYFARIRDAAAENMLLSGAVHLFLLRNDGGASIQGPLVLQYGDEAPHHGLMVYWTVVEDVTGDFTPGDPSV